MLPSNARYLSKRHATADPRNSQQRRGFRGAGRASLPVQTLQTGARPLAGSAVPRAEWRLFPEEPMKAFRFVEPGRSEMIDVAEPAPGPGEVLLQVAVVGLCGTDLNTFV